MWNMPTKEELKGLPGMYDTEGVELREKLILMHFFLGGCDWYAVEFDGEDLFFGYAVLNGDLENAEWGYFSLKELAAIKVGPGVEVDRDLHWKPRLAHEVDKILIN